MGLRSLYTDIKGVVKDIKNIDGTPMFKYTSIWNDQLSSIKTDNDWKSITYPAVFIEIIVKDIEQQALRHQLWLCDINFHIIDDFYNSDNFEENTRVFDYSDSLWATFQCRKLPMSSLFIGTQQVQDYDHNNVYHYVQSYEATYEYVYPDMLVPTTGLTFSISMTSSQF